MPGTYGHLFQRFFDFVFAKRLAPHELSSVERWLNDDETAIFFAQEHRDQAHGYASGLAMKEDGFEGAVVVAALLHDVGKRHARLGAVGRSVTSIFIKMKLPLSARMKAYRDHGQVAASELASIGCASVVVDFARSHHGKRPPTIDEIVWTALQRADNPAKTFIPTARR